MSARPSDGFTEQKIVVGVGNLAVSSDPHITLATYSLGSCLGVSIYDPVAQVGGLLHVMLPSSGVDQAKASQRPALFVDTGIAALFRAAYPLRADKYRVQICLAGGAQAMGGPAGLNMGLRNYEALTSILSQHSLRPQAEQIGGLVSRSMSLCLATGQVRLKISGSSEEVILWTN